MDQSKRLPPDSREEILTAAVRAFAARGYAGTSAREVAEAAGVKEPLLFYHFRNKAGLYLAAFEMQLARLVEDLEHTLARQHDAYEQLKTFVEVYLKHHLDDESGLGMVATEFGGLPADIRTSIVTLNRTHILSRLMEILSGGVEQGAFRSINVSICTNAIFGLLVTFIRDHERGWQRLDRDAIVEQVLDYYGAGLLPGAAGISARMQSSVQSAADRA